MREEGAADLPSPRRRACHPLDRAVAELVLFLLVKHKKSPITRSEMVKYMIGDLKDLFPKIIVRTAEHLRYVFGFELKQLGRKQHT